MKQIFLLYMMLFSTMIFSQKQIVLFVMSSEDTLKLNNEAKLRQTGVFLNEFYLAYKAVKDAGYSVEFATPNGVQATIDQESINDKYWKKKIAVKKEALSFIENDINFKNPISLTQAIENKKQYVGLVIPGGQGLMVDLLYDKRIPILLKYFANENKPTGLICHAPVLISTIPKLENPYAGFKVNSVSPIEEFVIESFIMKGKPKNRKIAKRLRKLGLRYRSGLPKSNFAIKDRNLVTSQNPYSSYAFNKLYIAALLEYNVDN